MNRIKRALACVLTVVILLTTAQFSMLASAATTVSKMQNFKIGERYSGVKFFWTKNTSAQGYLVYKSYDRENWFRIKKLTKNSYTSCTDRDVSNNELCFYRMRAYKNVGGKTYYSSYSEVKKVFYGLNEYITKTNDSIKVKWSPFTYGADGYEIYMSTNNGNMNKVKTLTKSTYKASTITGLNTRKNSYAIMFAAYKKNSNGKKEYVYYSDYMYSDSVETLINSTPKTIKSYTNLNYQGSSVQKTGTTSITDSDKKIFAAYESKFISTQMSVYWKMYYTLMYIHDSVDYAYNYDLVWDHSLTDAIFNLHLGQCLQYNGAMIAYLAYYGFDASLIMGYRGYSNDNKWQHFWGEVYLADGNTYVIETGNAGSDGTWHYFFTPYSQTRGYMKCGNVM